MLCSVDIPGNGGGWIWGSGDVGKLGGVEGEDCGQDVLIVCEKN